MSTIRVSSLHFITWPYETKDETGYELLNAICWLIQIVNFQFSIFNFQFSILNYLPCDVVSCVEPSEALAKSKGPLSIPFTFRTFAALKMKVLWRVRNLWHYIH